MEKELRFGLYVMLQDPFYIDIYKRFLESIEYVRLAEKYNFDIIFCGQHYVTYPYVMLHPIPFLARLMAESKRLFFGTGILLLALHHPVEVADYVSTLDIISGGKFIFGVGLGYREEEYEAFGINKKDASERFYESLDLIKSIWQNEELSFEGKYFKFKKLKFTLKPLQKPHPPIWIAANNDKAIIKIGQKGYVWYANPHVTLSTIERQLNLYFNELKTNKHEIPKDLPILREIFISPDRDIAYSKARPFLEKKYQTYSSWGQDKVVPPEEHFRKEFEELAKGRFIIGNPGRLY